LPAYSKARYCCENEFQLGLAIKPARLPLARIAGVVGKPRQLDELLQHNKNEPTTALCDQCVDALKYADARTWKWFRDHREQLKL
jgi:hypothetical protein